MEKTRNPWVLSPFLKNLKREKFIREHISNYFHVFVSTVESKGGFTLTKLMYAPLQYLRSPVLKIWDSVKLHKFTDASSPAIPTHGSALRPITAEVKGSWIVSCQKVLELFAWVLLFSILNAEIEAEQKISNLPEAEQRGTGYRGKEVTPNVYSSIGRLFCPTIMHCKEN